MNTSILTKSEVTDIIHNYYDGNKTDAIAKLLEGRADKPLTLAAATADVTRYMTASTAQAFQHSLQHRAETTE